MNNKYINNDYFLKIDIIVSTTLQTLNIYKLGVTANIICIFFMVSISKLQLLLQFEKTRLFFSIVFIITLFLKKNII
jgi:hypothetical protein